MRTLYTISVFLHIFSVIFWLGGATFLSFVLIPSISRSQEYPTLFEKIAKRYSGITWSLLFPLILITGYFNAYMRTGFLSPAKWLEVSYDIFLKFHIFFLIVLLSAVHDFWLGKKAVEYLKAGKNSPLRKASAWIGRINFVLGIIMLLLGIRIVRGW